MLAEPGYTPKHSTENAKLDCDTTPSFYRYDDPGTVIVNISVVTKNGVGCAEGMANGTGECVGNAVSEEAVAVSNTCEDHHDVISVTASDEIAIILETALCPLGTFTFKNKVAAGGNVPLYELGTY